MRAFVHWMIFSVPGTIFVAGIIGGGFVSYLSFIYDYRINKMSEKHEKQMTEAMHALSTLLENEIKQTEHIRQLLEQRKG